MDNGEHGYNYCTPPQPRGKRESQARQTHPSYGSTNNGEAMIIFENVLALTQKTVHFLFWGRNLQCAEHYTPFPRVVYVDPKTISKAYPKMQYKKDKIPRVGFLSLLVLFMLLFPHTTSHKQQQHPPERKIRKAKAIGISRRSRALALRESVTFSLERIRHFSFTIASPRPSLPKIRPLPPQPLHPHPLAHHSLRAAGTSTISHTVQVWCWIMLRDRSALIVLDILVCRLDFSVAGSTSTI